MSRRTETRTVMTNLRWGQILISLGLGILLGWLASRRNGERTFNRAEISY